VKGGDAAARSSEPVNKKRLARRERGFAVLVGRSREDKRLRVLERMEEISAVVPDTPGRVFTTGRPRSNSGAFEQRVPAWSESRFRPPCGQMEVSPGTADG
jgi:hypothetical protein